MAGEEVLDVVEGETAFRHFVLKKDGQSVDMRNDSGPASVVLRDKNDLLQTFQGTVTNLSPIQGLIRLAPTSQDWVFEKGDYALKFARPDSNGTTSYHPRDRAIRVRVHRGDTAP